MVKLDRMLIAGKVMIVFLNIGAHLMREKGWQKNPGLMCTLLPTGSLNGGKGDESKTLYKSSQTGIKPKVVNYASE